jgi:branched-chain amino acid transport system substrate-binding protein
MLPPELGGKVRRREFVTFLGGAAATWSLAARAQQGRDPNINIGVLTDLSGLFATLAGEGSVVAAHMAVEDFGGEVLGSKIRVLFADHKHQVDVASAIATQWFNEAHVGAVVDMPNSTVALATQKLADAHDRIAVTVLGGTSDLTGKACTSTGFHWAYDTYSNTVGIARAMVGFGLDTWYFITADYSFGWTLEQDASSAVKNAGGKVVGRSLHPLNTDKFGEYLTAAQDSGAKVIALANAGGDTINAVRQGAEVGISPRSQTLVPLLVFISDVNSIGLEVAHGMTFVDGFYWDSNRHTRDWSKRFYARCGAMPTMAQAGVYSAVFHYLRAVRACGTDEGKIVAKSMRQLRVDDFFAPGGVVRADGRLVHDMYLVEVKPPEESRYPWDYYKVLSVIPGDKAFRPVAEGGCPLVPT